MGLDCGVSSLQITWEGVWPAQFGDGGLYRIASLTKMVAAPRELPEDPIWRDTGINSGLETCSQASTITGLPGLTLGVCVNVWGGVEEGMR